jgi:hypothetical protein
LREALSGMHVKVRLGGRILEDEKFWIGYDAELANSFNLTDVALVVQPSIVESNPRNLLRAIAANVPIVTTPESGLHPGCGAIFVEAMDPNALKAAITAQLGSRRASAPNQLIPDPLASLETSKDSSC